MSQWSLGLWRHEERAAEKTAEGGEPFCVSWQRQIRKRHEFLWGPVTLRPAAVPVRLESLPRLVELYGSRLANSGGSCC